MHVVSDDPEVHRLVALIAETVTANGGMVHPELMVNHSGASLWLSLPRAANPHADDDLDQPLPDAPTLLVIPNELHIPVTNLDWVPSDDHLAYRGSTEHLTEPQRTILDAMVELFNAIDKVRVIGQGYAQHALDDADDGDPELLSLIREARPNFGRTSGVTSDGPTAPGAMQVSGPGPDDAAPDAQLPPDLAGESPAHTVVRSRLRSEMGEGDEGPIGFFMPMIDMLNHHPYGSRYERAADGAWLIRVHHPTPSDQVFVRYNKADALGVALGLGYFEPDARFVASVACEFELAPIGRVRVLGVSASRRRLPTPRVERTDDGLARSGVVLEHGRRDALAMLLAMPLRSMLPDASAAKIESLTDHLLAAIVAANVDFYSRLAGLCAPRPEKATDTSAQPATCPLRPIMWLVALRQLELLAEWN